MINMYTIDYKSYMEEKIRRSLDFIKRCLTIAITLILQLRPVIVIMGSMQ